MKQYLVFRLYGPITSWGEIAVGENRHSFSYPSKSAVIGLIASALGYKREEENKHTQLTNSLSFGIKVYNSGILLKDYHTTQVPPFQQKVVYFTRKEELEDKLNLNTILSAREYRMDSLYDVCIWEKNNSFQLQEIEKKLKEPNFCLYLGRKSCVLSSPLFTSLVEAENLFLAFEKYEKGLKEIFLQKEINYEQIFQIKEKQLIEYLWEDESQETSVEIRFRRDEVLSRKRWQFAERKEFYKSEEK